MAGKRDIQADKQRFLEELDNHAGNVRKAAEAAGIPQTTLYYWKRNDRDFSASWDLIAGSHGEERMNGRIPAAEVRTPAEEPDGITGPAGVPRIDITGKLEKYREMIRATMGERYAPEYDLAIRNLAHLLYRRDMMAAQAETFGALHLEQGMYGRRLVSNPVNRELISISRAINESLRALGLTKDAIGERQETGHKSFFADLDD